MGVVTLCTLELTSASSWSYFSHPGDRCPVCNVMFSRRPAAVVTLDNAQCRSEDTTYLPRDGSGVVSVRVGNIGYSILGSCPVSEFKNATISFSSLSPSLTPS